MSQKCKVQINLNEISSKKVSSVKKALEPDNINFPKGLSLDIEQKGNCLMAPRRWPLAYGPSDT